MRTTLASKPCLGSECVTDVTFVVLAEVLTLTGDQAGLVVLDEARSVVHRVAGGCEPDRSPPRSS